MTGTVRKQRLRNPYREALRTYLRWPVVLVAVLAVVAALIAALLLAMEPPPRITFGGGFEFAICLMYLGMVLAEHLRTMLGSPQSRVTPRVLNTHLLVAGAMTLIVGLVVPCLMAGLTVGLGERALAVVAVTLSALTFPAMLVQHRLGAALSVLIWIPLLLGQLMYPGSGFFIETPVSVPSSLAMLLASLASLLVLANFFLQFREETPGYSRHRLLEPLWGPRPTVRDGGDAERLQWSRFRVPLPRNLRALGGKSPGAGESLVHRGLHWHAASQVGWNMLLQGIWIGVMALVPVMESFLVERSLVRSLGHISGLICLAAPLVGLYPAFAMGLQPAVRARVAGEFLRPFSRNQHVQAVGLLLIVFLTSESLAFMLFPVAALWLVASKADWSQQASWPLAAGLSAIPLFLGVGLANLRESEVFWAILGSWIAYPLFLWLAASCEGKGGGWPLFGLCALMAAIGLATMRGAYRSWLNRDVA